MFRLPSLPILCILPLQGLQPNPHVLFSFSPPSSDLTDTSLFQGDKGVEGQRLTKVDRCDDVVPVQKVDSNISNAIKHRRAEEGFKLTQSQLAQKVNVSSNDIKTLESGAAVKNQQLLNKVCRHLKISPKTGEPLPDRR